jgi:hypothetical protein
MQCVLEVMRCVLLCLLGTMGGELNMLKALKVMLCVLPCTLEATEGGLCLLEALEVMCCVLLCLPEVSEVLKVMRCVLQAVVDSVCWRLWKVCAVCMYTKD